MPRARSRACLQHDPRLDLPDLIRRGAFKPGALKGARFRGDGMVIAADMRDPECGGWLAIKSGENCQKIRLVALPRHFGGYQWYFLCPKIGIWASVLYRPPGARCYASRKAWGGRVASASQFERAADRAYRAQQKIKNRLIGNLDPDAWDLPPKPKTMRWATYNRLAEKFYALESVRNLAFLAGAARICGYQR